MKKNLIGKFNLIFACIFFIQISGCTNDTAPPSGQRLHSADSREYIYIYDIFNDYPALKSLFTYGNLSTDVFEDKLFDTLNDKTQADVLVAMADGLPPLFDKREVPKGLFSSDLELEMNQKGPIPDLVTSISAITNSILLLNSEQVDPIYGFLDDLYEIETTPLDPDKPVEILDIIIEMQRKTVAYFSTLDANDINTYNDLSTNDLKDMELVGDGKSDFTDTNDALKDFVSEAPGGLAKIIQGMKPFLYDEELRGLLEEVFYKFGEFMSKPELPQLAEDLLRNLNNSHGKEVLGEMFSMAWGKGPIIGPVITEMDIEAYGKDGKQDQALQDYLKNPKLLNDFIEYLYRVDRMSGSIGFDGMGEMLKTYAAHNPFLQPRNGDGDFGNGRFYEPNENFSYKNFSGLRGLISLFNRANIPMAMTSNIMYESEGSENSKNLIRAMMPEADTLPLMSLLWAEIYEKDENDLSLGNGRPVTEDIGYGIMIDGKYVAPVCPAVRGMACMFGFLVGDGLYKGPHDNIYDNYNWLMYERKTTFTMDLVQFAEYIPALKVILKPMLKLFGYKSLPITLMEANGLFSFLTMEVGTIIQNLPQAIYHNPELSGFPDATIGLIIKLMERFLPMGTPVEGMDKLYLMPEDIRATASLIASFGFYSSEAFHGDRWQDFANPNNHCMYYDPTEYTFEKDKDKLNPILSFMAACTVGMNKTYNDVVKDFPMTMEGAEARQLAAMEEFGVIHPMQLMMNILSSMAEASTESSIFDPPDSEAIKLIKYLEPIAAMESTGLVDSVLKLVAVIGKPELADARMNIFEGLAEIIETTDKYSTGAYAYAGDMLSRPIKAKTDSRYWDMLELNMKATGALFSKDSEYEIVSSIIDLLQHISSVEIDDEEYARVSEGIVQILGEITKDQLLTRMSVNMAEITRHMNSTKSWHDILYLMNEALKYDKDSPEVGTMKYLLFGIDRDPSYTWEHILQETDWFLRSDLMAKYEEGSFWRELYYMMNFFSNMLE